MDGPMMRNNPLPCVRPSADNVVLSILSFGICK
jgi:hypothetical protein